MEITISGEDKKLLKQVKELAQQLGLNISTKPGNGRLNKNNAIAMAALEQLSKIGAFKEIEDPVAWQKKIRQDRYTGRDD